MDYTPELNIQKNTVINDKGFNLDGSFSYPTAADGYTDGFDGLILNETLEPGMSVDRHCNFKG